MRILHLADLHLGKRVHGFSMLEDQRYALREILKIVEEKNVDTVLIAGDVYDQTIPSGEAMALCDGFLTALSQMSKSCLIISGNHDSQERLSFARDLLKSSGIYISEKYKGSLEPVILYDEYGPINFYLLPFTKPIYLKEYYPDLALDDFQMALGNLLGDLKIDKSERNIIVTHQFIVGAQTSESEELYLGGSEAISLDLYKDFDYVAMGHIHKRQTFRDGMVSYPGSLLKYSKSESNYEKKLVILEIKEKGKIELEECEIEYLRDMRHIKGTFAMIMEGGYEDKNSQDYVHISLYDEDEVYDGLNRLREVYPNLMSLSYENRSLVDLEETTYQMRKSKDPMELFEEFYEIRNNRVLDADKRELLKDVMAEIWGKHEDS